MTMTTTTVTQQLRLGSPLSLSCSVPSCRSGTPTDTTLGSDSRARTGMYRWRAGTLHHFGGKVYGWLCVRELLGLGPGIARARPRFTEIDQNPIENSTVFNPKNLPFKKTSRRFQDGEQPTSQIRRRYFLVEQRLVAKIARTAAREKATERKTVNRKATGSSTV